MPAKPLPGPSALSGILRNLSKSPRLPLSTLRNLKLSLAAKNDDFGARHFLREELPRIRYANPDLNIQVKKLPKNPKDTLKTEMALEFKDGRSKVIDMSQKWSTGILEELMETAGGDRWQLYKEERRLAGGEPIIPTVTLRARNARHNTHTPNPNRTGVAASLP